ncbi:HEPN domain-containing protein [uncultured Adlercreutzia sp.]|uniref:HEPN domain-containing protein n=1 Tax=uncultured Adlercreutzia sp. TaxID=875803 RepID=UPI0025E6E5AC|nr:HEPN domain-containing protein [uncultured Adlercreutzia sp.]MCI9261627.1 hypothetical protein [Eggerthellaceae bacterium]
MSTEVFLRYKTNLARVDSMLVIYEEIRKTALPEDAKATDILRSCIVFLHGAQEDYLRTLLALWLPRKATREVLKDIPLMGRDGHSLKYTLQDLLPLRGLDIDDVINNSVGQALQRQTFNSYSEIVSWLQKIDIDLREFSEQSSIDAMTKRRHRIVHEVDTVRKDESNAAGRLSMIEAKTVKKWMEASRSLVQTIDLQAEKWDITNSE